MKESKQRWLELWERIGAQGNGEIVDTDLVARYSEPHRVYHTLRHIEDCLKELEVVRCFARNPDAVEMALWYHDAIYDTRSIKNEEESAKLFREMAINASLPEAFISQVVNLILATKHVKVPRVSDAKLLVDIDLSILGQPQGKFNEYEEQIRKEYEWVPLEAFILGRSKILKSLLLKRATIYSTDFFRNKYEAMARQNIVRSLTKLSQYP